MRGVQIARNLHKKSCSLCNQISRFHCTGNAVTGQHQCHCVSLGHNRRDTVRLRAVTHKHIITDTDAIDNIISGRQIIWHNELSCLSLCRDQNRGRAECDLAVAENRSIKDANTKLGSSAKVGRRIAIKRYMQCIGVFPIGAGDKFVFMQERRTGYPLAISGPHTKVPNFWRFTLKAYRDGHRFFKRCTVG